MNKPTHLLRVGRGRCLPPSPADAQPMMNRARHPTRPSFNTRVRSALSIWLVATLVCRSSSGTDQVPSSAMSSLVAVVTGAGASGARVLVTSLAAASAAVLTWKGDVAAAPARALPVEAPPPGTERNPPLINAATSRGGVHTLTGSYITSRVDTRIRGRGPAPLFVRTYNSNDTRIGPLGPGWTHSYAMRLADPGDASGAVILVGPQGRSDRYTDRKS